MSVGAVGRVLERSLATGTGRLVAVALAYRLPEGGATTEVCIGIPELQRLTCASRRAVQMALRDLEQSGEIRTVRRGGGDVVPIYELMIARPA